MLPLTELDYDLPPELIATRPAEPRDSARLMVVSRSDASLMEHKRFSDLPSYLRASDVLVFNKSWVIPARFRAVRADTGGKVEGLYLKSAGEGLWEVLLQAGGRLQPGLRVRLLGHDRTPTTYTLQLDRRESEGWRAELREGPEFERSHARVNEVLMKVGETPLPPYIVNARRDHNEHIPDHQDRAWYQAVYADPAARGSVAAPTAGLHFTPELLGAIESKTVARADVILHVGAGTFKPVQTEFIEQHPIHAERVLIPPAAVRAIETARTAGAAGAGGNGGAEGASGAGGRVIPVGTTTVRALESLPDPIDARTREFGWTGETRLLIAPGHPFRWTDALVTNFHLPRSTLLAVVAALFPDGMERVRRLYAAAVQEKYRFFSYGDAMLVLP